MTRDQIRTIFMANGFTIKEGQTDLRDYVYQAAEALLAASTSTAPVPRGLTPIVDTDAVFGKALKFYPDAASSGQASTAAPSQGFVFPPMPPAVLQHEKVGALFDRLSMQFYAEKCMRLAAFSSAPMCEQCGDGIVAHNPGICGTCHAISASAEPLPTDCAVRGGTGDVSGEYPGEACHACGGTGKSAPRLAAQEDPIRKLVERHAEELEQNEYAYFELAYTRRTEWMAWICSNHRDDDPNRKVLARGQGFTPEEACAAALDAIASQSASKEKQHG